MKYATIISFLFTFVIFISISSCSKDEPIEVMTEEVFTILTPCEYSISLGNETLERKQSAMLDGLSCNVTFSGSGDSYSYGASLKTNNSEEEFNISGGTIDNLGWLEQPTSEQFDSLFFIGMYEFTNGNDQGIRLSYKSASEEFWSTNNGSADQSSSSFEMLEKVSSTISGVYLLNTRAKFKCNLYNSNGEVKVCEGTATFILQSS